MLHNIMVGAIALAAAVATGCAEYTAGKAAVKEESALIANEQWQASAWAYCNANSTGELLRKGETERAEYIAHCLKIKRSD